MNPLSPSSPVTPSIPGPAAAGKLLKRKSNLLVVLQTLVSDTKSRRPVASESAFPSAVMTASPSTIAGWPAATAFAFLLFTSYAHAVEPLLEVKGIAPDGMVIVKEAVTLRLKNPTIKFRLYCAKSFNSTQEAGLFYPAYVFQTTRIRPSGSPSFTDIFGVEWFDFTPDSGSDNRLILGPELTAILEQGNVPPNIGVGLGRWAITELRLSSPTKPTQSGDFVYYDFEMQCYLPGGAAGEGHILTQFHRSLRLSFPVSGVPMGSVSPTGVIEPESVISPVDFRFAVTNPSPNVVREELTAVPVMTQMKPWIYGRDTTFDLGNWTLDPPSTIPELLSVRNSWNRAFENIGRHVCESTLFQGRTLGFRRSGVPFLPEYSPFFFHNFPVDASGNPVPVSGNLQTYMQEVASSTPMEGLWPFDEDLILHAAPSSSPSTGGGFAAAMDAAGLSGDAALPLAIPFHDGVPNILKFALNMNLTAHDGRTMSHGGTAGLPLIEVSGDGPFRCLQIHFVRSRAAAGLIYSVQFGSVLAESEPDGFMLAGGEQIIEVIDENWERVTIKDTVTGALQRFARMKLDYFP